MIAISQNNSGAGVAMRLYCILACSWSSYLAVVGIILIATAITLSSVQAQGTTQKKVKEAVSGACKPEYENHRLSRRVGCLRAFRQGFSGLCCFKTATREDAICSPEVTDDPNATGEITNSIFPLGYSLESKDVRPGQHIIVAGKQRIQLLIDLNTSETGEVCCNICQDMMINPQRVCDKGVHVYCAGCVRALSPAQCPECSTSIPGKYPLFCGITKKKINNLNISCPNCKISLTLCELSAHLDQCEVTGGVFQCEFCEQLIESRLLMHHVPACPAYTVKKLTEGILNESQQQQLRMLDMEPCQVEGCEQQFPLYEKQRIKLHMRTHAEQLQGKLLNDRELFLPVNCFSLPPWGDSSKPLDRIMALRRSDGKSYLLCAGKALEYSEYLLYAIGEWNLIFAIKKISLGYTSVVVTTPYYCPVGLEDDAQLLFEFYQDESNKLAKCIRISVKTLKDNLIPKPREEMNERERNRVPKALDFSFKLLPGTQDDHLFEFVKISVINRLSRQGERVSYDEYPRATSILGNNWNNHVKLVKNQKFAPSGQ